MDDPVRLGQTPFALGPRIASGGFAEVFRGLHLPSRRPVALKAVVGEGARFDQSAALIRRELGLVARLDHPHIVRVHDLLEVDAAMEVATAGRLREGSPVLVMDWCSGGSLLDVHGPLEWATVRGIALQLFSALAHAHAAGVLHLDVKPDNVFVTSVVGGTVALGDFGIAALQAAAAGEEGARLRAGTEGFMAPEQRRDERWSVQPHSDVYAAGLTLRWLLDRHRPKVPAGLNDVLAAMTAWDPVHRLATAPHALAALRALGPAELDWEVQPAPTGAETLFLDEDFGEEAAGPPAAVVSTRIPTTVVLPSEWAPRSVDPLIGTGIGGLNFRFLRMPLVGRSIAQSQLWRWLSQVRTGGSERVWLRGPAGIGKSRLGDDLIREARESGAAWALTLRFDGGAAVAEATRDGVLHWMGVVGQPVDARVARAEQLARQLQLAEDPAACLMDLAGDRVSGRGVEASLQVLVGAYDAPLVVFLDDATPEAMALAERLAGRDKTLVLASGPEDAPDGWQTLGLDLLTEAQVRFLAQRMLLAVPDVADQLVRACTGNPLELSELLRDWVHRGWVVRASEGWAFAEGAQLAPSEVWTRRVADWCAMPGRALELEVAAALGPRFRAEDWRAALVRGGIEARDSALDAWTDLGLIRLGQDGRWVWTHGSARQAVVHRGLARAHRLCAEALDAAGATRMRRAEQWEGAGELRRAGELWRDAAEDQRSKDDDVTGLECLYAAERCLRPLMPEDDPGWLELRVLEAVLLEGSFQYDLMRELVDRLRADGVARGWAAAELWADWLLARLHFQLDDAAAAFELLRDLPARADATDDVLLQARVRFDLGRTLAVSGRAREGVARLREAVSLYGVVGYANGLDIATVFLAYALSELGELDEAQRVLDDHTPLLGDEAYDSRAHRELMYATIHGLRGEYALAEEALLREREAQPFRRRWLSRINLALVRAARELTPARVVEVQSAIAELEHRQAPLHAGLGHGMLLQYLIRLDYREAFDRHLAAAEQVLLPSSYTSCEVLHGLDEAVEAMGDRDWGDGLARLTALRDAIASRRID